MELKIDEEFKTICCRIVSENRKTDEWREVESCDAFQSTHYCGGYDADEDAFCFSYYDGEKSEWWFQLTLDEVQKVVSGELNRIFIRRPS